MWQEFCAARDPFSLEQERRDDRLSACAFLAKPFDRKSLLEAVDKCLSPEHAAGGGPTF